MAYTKGDDVFPEALLKEIQKYVSGGLVYIPQKKTERKEWGACSGAKLELKKRNAAIRSQFSAGISIEALTEQYFLSVETIKRIVYTKEK